MPPPFLPVLALLAALSAAQTPLRKIAFPRFLRNPVGWERYDINELSAGAEFGSNGPTANRPLRFFVKQKPGFAYRVTDLLPGVYTVKFGLFEKTGCVLEQRVFYFDANGMRTPNIDVFAKVGCGVPYYEILHDVVVAADGLLTIKSQKVKGFKPMLSNVEITGTGPPDTDPSVSPSPSPGSSASSSPAALESASPPASASPSASPAGDTSTFPTTAKVSFPKFETAAGWTKYDEIGLEALVAFGSTGVTTIPAEYRSHAKKKGGFTYVHKLAPGAYDVRLGFLEYAAAACVLGKRVFKVSANGIETNPIDVYGAVGCQSPHTVMVSNVLVGAEGKLTLQTIRIDGYAPYLSNFEANPHDPTVEPSPSPTEVDIQINVGSNSETVIANEYTDKTYFNVDVTVEAGYAPKGFYKSARYGKMFTYDFDFAPGAYDVTIGFAEIYPPHCMETGKRVFKVFINEMIQLEGYDIFARNGCYKAEEITFSSQTVGAVNTKPLSIRFEATANNAQVAFIKIKTAADNCIPASSGGSLMAADHAAHSVPGTYPPQLNGNSPTYYVDSAGDGFVSVTIDGKGSHTHFFDSANNIIGEITEYKWTLAETGEVISTKKSFTYDFPLGTTRLRLAVLDNSCTRDEAETTVTVTGAIQPGQYCYYYQGLSELPMGGTLLEATNPPSFAAISPSLDLGFPSFDFDQTMFAARCHFFLQVDEESPESKISVNTDGSGIAKVYKGADLILDSLFSLDTMTNLAVGLTAFEVVYLRTADAATPAQLTFLVNDLMPANSHVSHDRKTVLPILSAVTPHEGQMSGGTNVKVTGYGLFQPLTVTFGDQSVSISANGEPTHFFVESPSASSPDAVPIIAKTDAGSSSNPVFFSYGSSCDSVKFTGTTMMHKANENTYGEVNFLSLPTCAVLGHDGNIYMGTLGGTVQVLGYHVETLIASSHCYSKPIKDATFTKNGFPAVRDILGIAIDPRDVEIKPYVSTSTLYWLDQHRLDDSPKNWRNGAVDRLKPGTDPADIKVCLVYDKRVVSNLPVSNHDHAVNALVFNQDGDLMISVGGFTNMGLPGWKLGGIWETHLSAAVLLAHTSKPDFDGDLKYSDEDVPRHAKLISGDVEIFATGIRNGFGMTMARSGEFYLADQGPNCAFGDTATDCASDYDETKAATWDPEAEVNWKGLVHHGWQACPYAIGRPDKIVHLTKGAYFGHPNVQRGLLGNQNHECYWVDPYDQLRADNQQIEAGAPYKEQMALLTSAVTGIGDYLANHFCGRLRGELILSAYKGDPTYRMGVDKGAVTSAPSQLSAEGGITFVENAHGDLIFPRLSKMKVVVLRPDTSARADLFVAGAVPFRHGLAGGTTLTIGGQNFGMDPSVTVGAHACVILTSSKTEIKCTVPAGASAGTAADVTVNSIEGETDTLSKAVLYMKV